MKRKFLKTRTIVGFAFGSHFVLDLYKIGFKDGKATKLAMQAQKVKK
jgi:hypothetical protein